MTDTEVAQESPASPKGELLMVSLNGVLMTAPDSCAEFSTSGQSLTVIIDSPLMLGDKLFPLLHQSSFGGDPLECSVQLAGSGLGFHGVASVTSLSVRSSGAVYYRAELLIASASPALV